MFSSLKNIMFRLLFSFLLMISCSYAHNNEQIKRMEAKKSVELKYNQDQFRILQNKINLINEQQQQILSEIDSLKRQTQKNKEAASNALKNSKSISLSIDKVETILKSNQKVEEASKKSGHEHIVESGHTLSVIAQAYGTTVDAIKQSNDLKNDVIYVGQKLFIPE